MLPPTVHDYRPRYFFPGRNLVTLDSWNGKDRIEGGHPIFTLDVKSDALLLLNSAGYGLSSLTELSGYQSVMISEQWPLSAYNPQQQRRICKHNSELCLN